jgi:hypothetical protein
MGQTFPSDLQYMMRVEDLEWLKKVGKPKANPDKVRELFFPQQTDPSATGAFRINKSWFSSIEYAMFVLFEQLFILKFLTGVQVQARPSISIIYNAATSIPRKSLPG